MIKKHKLKVIIFVIGMFIMKSIKYYSNDDVTLNNHTFQEDVLELGNNILEI